MLNYPALASAVINQAFEDALVDGKPPAFRGPGTWQKNRAGAIAFLTTHNEDLLLWCDIGGLNATAIVEASKKRFLAEGITF